MNEKIVWIVLDQHKQTIRAHRLCSGFKWLDHRTISLIDECGKRLWLGCGFFITELDAHNRIKDIMMSKSQYFAKNARIWSKLMEEQKANINNMITTERSAVIDQDDQKYIDDLGRVNCVDIVDHGFQPYDPKTNKIIK